MWVLQCSNKGELYYLPPGRHIVGRRDCDLILPDDKSISRFHAVVEVHHPQENWNHPNKWPEVKLIDSSSKYGTVLISGNSSSKVESGANKTISDGDEIHFGLQWNKWKVNYCPLVVVMSTLSRQEKEKVKTFIVTSGGHVVNEWHPEVTHLTMSSITMTVKAISALAYAKPIVSPAFWDAYKNAVRARTNLPSYEQYIPPLGETAINKHEVSFLVNDNRRNIFKGKTFVFFSEVQFKEHGCLVTAAGGKVELMHKITGNYDQFCKQNIVVMQYLASVNSQNTQQPQSFIDLTNFLKRNGKRPIPSSEIGLAILHCSVEKFSNPDFNFSSTLLGKTTNVTQDILKEQILAKETQASQPSLAIDVVIPDSGSEPKEAPSPHPAHNSASARKPLASPFTEDSQSTQMCIVPSQADSALSSPKIRLLPKRRIVDLVSSSDDEDQQPPYKKSNAFQEKPGRCSGSKTPNKSVLMERSIQSQNNDDDDPDELFEEFKVSKTDKLLTGHSVNTKMPLSREDDPEGLFGEFEVDPRMSKPPPRPPAASGLRAKRAQQESSRKVPAPTNVSPVPAAGPSKRVRSELSDNEEVPAQKFSKLDILRSAEEPDSPTNCINSEDFVAVAKVKQESDDSVQKTGCNVSVVLKPLVRRVEGSAASESNISSENLKNFKKFRKVAPTNHKIIPNIIGGCDLQPFKPSSVASSRAAFLDAGESDEEEDKGTDLWSALTKHRPAGNSRARRL